jgi:hypothetical protein
MVTVECRYWFSDRAGPLFIKIGHLHLFGRKGHFFIGVCEEKVALD